MANRSPCQIKPADPPLFPTALAFTTWAYALARTTAGMMGMTAYIIPVVTILLSWMFLGQTPAWLSFVGGGVCLAGVAVTRRKGRLAWRPRRVPAVVQPAGTGSALSKQPSNIDSGQII